MTSKKKTNARLTTELLETAKKMHASGIMTDAAYERITMRAFGGGGADTHTSKNQARSAVIRRGAKR